MYTSNSFDNNLTLYKALLHREEQAYDFLYEQLLSSFTNWVRLKNGSEMDAQDAFQKGLLNFLLNLETGKYEFRTETKVTTVIFDYCKKVWFNELKSARMKTNTELFDFVNPADSTDIEADLAREETILAVREAVQKLKEDCRKMMEWFYIEELSIREIAERLGMKESSTKQKRYDCTEKLKAFYLDIATKRF